MVVAGGPTGAGRRFFPYAGVTLVAVAASVFFIVYDNARRRALLDGRWNVIDHHVKAGRWDEARPLLEEWIALDLAATQGRGFHTAEAAGLLSEAKSRDNAPAMIAALEAKAANASAIEPRRRLVDLYAIVARDEDVRRVLWELYELAHDPRDLLAITGRAVSVSDDPDAPVRIDQFLAKTPGDVWLRRARGLRNHRLGRHAEARDDLLFAAERINDDPTGRMALVDCLLELGDIEGASVRLGPEPKSSRGRGAFWTLKALIETKQGRPGDALASLRKAVAAGSHSQVALDRLGRALAGLGPDHAAEAKAVRARAETRRIEFEALRSAVDRQVAAGPDPSAFEEIHRVCLAYGLDREARAWLEQAAVANPTRTDLRATLARLPDPRAEPGSGPTLIGAVAAKPRAGAPPFRFEEIAERSGLAYRYNPYPRDDFFIADTMGGGVGLFDYDGDGWLDVYFVGGCPLPYDPKSPPAPNRLYRNKRDGTFEDVTARAGVGGAGYGMGCTVGDYDNDGHDDLFVTGLGRTVLYRNRGDGTFEDVTARAGVASDRWTTASGFGDLDGDGDLDLVVITYVLVDPHQFTPCPGPYNKPSHCPPSRFEAQADHLFRNNGDGTFTDVARAAGLDVPNGDGLGLAIADLDDDGKLDLFIANDARPNFLFRNLGGLRFEEVGVAAGVALNGLGMATSSMGVIAADLDDDGRIDLYHTNFYDESNTFHKNVGRGHFSDETGGSGLASSNMASTGFGTVAADFDNDGRTDLFVANGHVDELPIQRITMAQLPQIYQGRGRGRYGVLPATREIPYFTRQVVGRGAASGDLDNDGRVDLVVIHRDVPIAYLHNITEPAGRWVGVKLVGSKSGKTPVGARVVLRAGAVERTLWRTSGTSYLSQSDDRLRFGLGSAETVDSIAVTWPSGLSQEFKGLAVGHDYRIEEGKSPVEIRPAQPEARR